MVEVFRTDVQKISESKTLIKKLFDHFQVDTISFDLEDCDKVLRVEGNYVPANKIVEFVTSLGYQCEVLI